MSLFVLGAFTLQLPAEEARYIILMIGDGMQLEHERAASYYWTGQPDGLSFHQLPVKAAVTTWDVDTYDTYAVKDEKPLFTPARFEPLLGYDPGQGGAMPWPLDRSGVNSYYLDKVRVPWKKRPVYPATDSASSATAMATGYKVPSKCVSWEPTRENGNDWLLKRIGGKPLKTIAELIREQKGRAIGVVSTVPVSHATPAAFVSHNQLRHMYSYDFRSEKKGLRGIANEIIHETKPDVVIGGGHPTWTHKPYWREEFSEELRASPEYVFVERTADVDAHDSLGAAAERAAAENRKLFGLSLIHI